MINPTDLTQKPTTRAVIFDFYGTLGRWRDSHASNYKAVFAALGYELPDEELDAYFARYDGVAHEEHSRSEEAYEQWVGHRLGELADVCGVVALEQKDVIAALRASDDGPMVAYPDARPTIEHLRDLGLTIGVCSNWGWHLDTAMREIGLLELVDWAITSARAGARKPHPSIYSQAMMRCGGDPGEVTFVGDSWSPDVDGPRRAGMSAVHVWRMEEHGGQRAPDLDDGVHRISRLTELPSLLGLS